MQFHRISHRTFYLAEYRAALNTPGFVCLREEYFCRLKQSCGICFSPPCLIILHTHFSVSQFRAYPHLCFCSISLSEYLYLFFPSQPSLPDPVSVISHLVQVLTPAEFWQAQCSCLLPMGANYYHSMGSSSPLCRGSQLPTL